MKRGPGRPRKDTPLPTDKMMELELNTPKTSRKRNIEIGETPKSKKGKKSYAKTNEIKCLTLSSDEDEPMEISKDNILASKDLNDCVTLSSDEEMEFENLPKEVESAKPVMAIDFEDANLSIDFATTRNTRTNIWRRAQLPLYQRTKS